MKKITILIFMTLCLLLTGCQENVNKTEQKEAKQETTDAAKAKIECEYTWATSHCAYRTEELPDGDGDDEWQEWLVQCDYQGNVLQKIPEKKFGTEIITFFDVSENEILFSEESDQINVYSVPVIWKDGKEEIAVNKKQLVFENDLDSRFNDFEYIASTKECILFQYDFGDKMAEYDRRSKKFSKMEYNNVQLEDGDIIYQNNNDSFVFSATQRSESAVYHYNYETKKVQEIIKNQEYMLYQAGEDKLFFTAVKGEKSGLCYDVYQYDCKNGKKSVLVTEEQIRNVLSEKPEAGMDLIREIAYEDGKVKLEINVKEKGALLCCDTQTGKLVQEGEGRLQKTREYPLEKPLTNANQNYNYANDYNVFVQISEEDKSNCPLDEYTLDGKFVRHIFTNNLCDTKYWYLLYANNEELLFSVSREEDEYLYVVPLVIVDGSSFPQMEKAEKIVKMEIEKSDSSLYVDKNYIIFTDEMSQIHVYDRKKKTFVKVKGIPKTDMNLVTKVGNYFIFDSIAYCTTKNGKARYAFSYYKTGSDQLHIMDPMCYGVIIGDEKRKQVIYVRGTKIWTYDLQHNKKECLVKVNKKEDVYEMCIRKDRLYVFTTGEMIDGESTNGYSTDVYSYSLEGKDKQLCYEKEFTEALKKFEQENDENMLWAYDFSEVNNKIDIRGEADDYYLCYDPDTKQLKQVRKNDPEMFCFLVNKS